MSIGITSASLGYSRSASDLRYLGKTGLQTLSGGLSFNELSLAGSGSLSGSALDIAQTWNTTGTPTAIKLNVTDTASNASSLLMDLQVGGESKFNVTKGGLLAIGTLNVNNGAFQVRDDSNGITFNATDFTYGTGAAAAHRAALKTPASDPAGVTGATAISNIISLTQAQYDAITPDSSTLYIITD